MSVRSPMSTQPPEDPHNLLEKWEIKPPPDIHLADRVINQIRTSPAASPAEPPLSSWLAWLVKRPVYVGGFAAVFLVTGGLIALMAVLMLRESNPTASPVEYRLVIDPVYRLTQSAELSPPRDLADADAMIEALNWLKKELRLDGDQFSKLVSLHGNFEATFAGQFQDLQASEALMNDFDQLRFQSELIDFIEVYRTLENFKKQRVRASETTADLVHQVSEIVTSEQRGRYLELLGDLSQFRKESTRGAPPAT